MKHHRFSVIGTSGNPFDVRFRVNPRAKRLILRIDPKLGEAVITAPRQRDFKAAQRFATERVDWIETHTSAFSTELALIPGADIPFRGVEHRLTRSADRGKTRAQTEPEPVIDSPGAEETYSDRLIRFFRMEARHALSEAVDKHAERLAAQPQRITIRDTVSRWGSCSAKGHLNFSWRLILAPPEVLDYVAAHEVAHLIEMNHSKAFWALVEASFGPHQQARNWLKTNGRRLQSVGRAGSSGG